MWSAANWRPRANWRSSASTWQTVRAMARIAVTGHFITGQLQLSPGPAGEFQESIWTRRSRRSAAVPIRPWPCSPGPMSACSAVPISRRCCGIWGYGRGGGRQERRGARRGPAGFASVQHGDRAGLCGDAARLPTVILSAARMRAEEAAAVCRKHGFAYYLSVAEILAGWAMAMAGDARGGLARLRQGLETFKASGAELRLPFYHGLLAEACGRAGQMGEALANISSRLCVPEQERRSRGRRRICIAFMAICCCVMETGTQAQASYQRSLETARARGRSHVSNSGRLLVCANCGTPVLPVRRTLSERLACQIRVVRQADSPMSFGLGTDHTAQTVGGQRWLSEASDGLTGE